jgi:3-methyl-2-oxobutanoate hydroxymethyltransferase
MSATGSNDQVRRLTVTDIARMHAEGERIAMLTAYDYPTARLLDEAGIPIILVGDSVGRAILGYENEIAVSMADMLHHTRAVSRGARRALVVGDMPFLSYATPERALENAGRFLAEGGAQAVKVEGGVRSAKIIETLVRAGIAVMGHIGLTPQAITTIGRVRVQGRTKETARRLLADAQAVADAGAFAVVLELIPVQLAAAITERLRIPTIGIGAGPYCSGQVQVVTDLLGLDAWRPKHARAYADLRSTILAAVRAYAADVAAGSFPGEAESVRMDDAVLDEVLGRGRLDRAADGGGESTEPPVRAPGHGRAETTGADEQAGRGWIPLDRDL